MVLKPLKADKFSATLLIVLVAVSLISFCFPATAQENVTQTSNPNIFADSFESNSFNAWDKIYVTAGESAKVTNNSNNIYAGNYSAMFSSNATGRTEKAYLNKTFASAINESYAQAYLKFSQIGLAGAENGARIKLIELRAGTKILAAAGLLIDDNIRWWIETRNGSSYVEKFNSHSNPNPEIFDWFRIELRWLNSATIGGGSLWVNGVLVYNINNVDTDDFGGCSQIRIGLAEIINSTATTAYLDNVVVSTEYIGDTPQKCTLTLGASGGGTIHPSPGPYQFIQGEIVQIQALDTTVESDTHLSHWLLNGTNADSLDATTLVMADNYNLTAVFVENDLGYEFGLFVGNLFSGFGVFVVLFVAVLVVVVLVGVRIRKKATHKDTIK